MKDYADYIRSLPCVACGTDGGSDIHHLIQIPGVEKGLAKRLPHLFGIPLCREHHRNLHSSVQDFEDWYGTQANLLVKTQKQALADGWRFKLLGDKS